MPTVVCVGCGAEVSDVSGPVHAYMCSSPGCWQLYGEVTAQNLAQAELRLALDCYAAQHPGGAEHELRQRQSVAVHLTSLCLHIEERLPAAQLMTRLNRMSRTVLPLLGASAWPYLPPPERMGDMTVADVRSVAPEQRAACLGDWAEAVWRSWSAQHETVRGWARLALKGR
ncbi:hypothetical protein CcI156_22705 [Frankia sp. CcI156]|jgi:hypothetical protein|uniref:Uncharacterized protein n=1 Tax=Frankia casuarinae (strain DSM 45818 / CECT 9043 / HFP020203 / CcI3) TaxID=106370 RepID=Q2J5H5_FRACC|nr:MULTISPECIES: DUF5946 family protein [Frankia]ABD13467.1 hypothetical protein Francci3_4119 [Frankia casuarinae]ESZ99669.1 hypothetical protein CcI6DRAFT_04917 [Frankia sp. CcI6]EYT89565.1 hypothetical protein ThrDRAFT_04823 [Frankia casuarinae]KFB01706.1 hypothetical protein ALLO2DRAFT_04814 [Frankia sp. Allo2]OFB45035.1 hypothetical protein Manayef4_22015 [Frankia sp. CgIM4]